MLTKPCVLIVDDDPTARSLVRDTLHAEFEVDEAGTSADALRMATTRQFDVAILDVEFGEGVSGYTLCWSLRRLPQGKALKIVFLTGFDGVVGYQSATASGADAFIAKPFSPTALLAQVRDLLAT